ncbi:YfcC family protein [Hoyosella subflava]|uniref:C4-dicarboxylate anaerobic carrier n=1 Tax=Hoyosella subflava (strain DSM 45089 / JCM 17490 / NBRC 109087 / DQS3-9A1) TaxID=443218 RepID=F6ELW8_HOYSD|nr:YfcC family protein [Hoyosella subflava]AEF42749.1 C4-dicarboxylate anaerobic carrier [Hoyosella subflava DQS3-9A1]
MSPRSDSQIAAAPEKEAPKKSFQVPHIYIILFGFIALASAATYLVPGGTYERVDGPGGRTTIDPDSFQFIDANPIGFTDFMLAIPQGLMSAGEVVFFTLMIGGVFMVLRATGIIELGVDKLSRRFASRSLVMIALLMILFSVIATLIGTQELSLVYVPVILPLIIALRYDSVTAAAIALCATTAGFASGVLNPINTGLGQQLAGLPLYSGWALRVTILVTTLSAAIFFVIRYARKVQKNPELSLLAGDALEASKRDEFHQHTLDEDSPVATMRQKLASAATLGFFALLVYGVLQQGWFMMEMAGLFILMGIVVGLIAGLNGTEICEAFNKGFREVLVGALIAGVARGVAVVLENGEILDTIVYGLGNLVGGLPVVLSAVGMFFAQLLFNFIVPSGSGQALVTMPIMAPLSDVLDVTRQTAVLAYQLGDGFGNILFPTSGYFMATLAIAGVPWQKWVRFFFPLFLTWMGIGLAFLIFAQVTGWT